MAVRAGFGRITLVDRDVVEPSNLARQFLFDAEDAARVAPEGRGRGRDGWREIDPACPSTAVVADLDHRNAREVLAGHDSSSTAPTTSRRGCSSRTRPARSAFPSIYAACVGEEGRVAVSVPGTTPCLRCYLEALPPAGSGPTCDTAGVVPTLPPLVASLGDDRGRCASRPGRARRRGILTLSVWAGGLSLAAALRGRAAVRRRARSARGGRFPALEGEGAAEMVKLCGRQSVQITPAGRARPDFDALESRLAPLGRVRRSPQLLNADVEDVEPDGLSGRPLRRARAPTTRRAPASLYDRYVGG